MWRSVFVMTAQQNHVFSNLLAAWRRREESRSTTTINELTQARASLDNARANMRSALSDQLR